MAGEHSAAKRAARKGGCLDGSRESISSFALRLEGLKPCIAGLKPRYHKYGDSELKVETGAAWGRPFYYGNHLKQLTSNKPFYLANHI